jgi:hypothetical protein
MKKVALLFTILCANGLNGMNKPEVGRYVGFEHLPTDVKTTIIIILNTHDTLDDTISAIKETSKKLSLTNKELNKIINEMYATQKAFTTLVHMLENKFKSDGLTTEEIAQKFGTPAAKTYITLGNSLILKAESSYYNEATLQLIQKKNADVNFSHRRDKFDFETGYDAITQNKIKTPLISAIQYLNDKIVKALLDKGAKPQSKDLEYIDLVKKNGLFTGISYRKSQETTEKIISIEQMVKKAM